MTHELKTPAELIRRVRAEKQRLSSELNEGRGYSGPDLNQLANAEKQARFEAMKDVLAWIKDAEIQAASDDVSNAMKAV